MSQPVKVPGELYEALRQRAREEETTLQEALVRTVRDGARERQALHKQLSQTTGDVAKARQGAEAMRRALDETRQSLAALSRDVQGLRAARSADLKAWQSWVSTWNQIPELCEQVAELGEQWGEMDERIRRLERTSHRHIGQRGKGE